MPISLRQLILDTSAFNALAADKERDAFVVALKVAYRLGITDAAFSEVVADPDEDRRKRLLDLFKRLLSHGDSLQPFHWIIEEQAKAYQRDPLRYDWHRFNAVFKEEEEEIARQKIIHSLSAEMLATQTRWNKEFLDIYRRARPAFQNIFQTHGRERPALREVTDHLLGAGGAHLTIGANLIEKATGIRPDEIATRDFMDRCPPFKALLASLCFVPYDRCLRPERHKSLGRAGRIDMFSAVYLPYCKVFVTNDEGQFNALKAVAGLIELKTSILMYETFRSGIFGLSLLR